MHRDRARNSLQTYLQNLYIDFLRIPDCTVYQLA